MPNETILTKFTVIGDDEKSPIWRFKNMEFAPYLPPVEVRYWQSSWIWCGQRNEPKAKRYFFREFEVNPEEITKAVFQFAADDGAQVFLNGKLLGTVRSWAVPCVNSQVKKFLRPGKNILAVEVFNLASSAGFMGELTLIHKNGEIKYIPSDHSWVGTAKNVANWNSSNFDCSKIDSVEVLMRPPQTPYGDTPYLDCAPLRQLVGDNKVVISSKELIVSSNIDELELYLQSALFNAPENYFMLFIGTDAPNWYISAHPEERYCHSNGPIDRISYASQLWKNDSTQFLKKLLVIRHQQTINH